MLLIEVIIIGQVMEQGNIINGYRFISFLGEGRYGQVWSVAKNGSVKACKITDEYGNDEYESRLAVDSSRLVKFTEKFENDGKCYLIMPLAQDSLNNICIEKGKRVTIDTAIYILKFLIYACIDIEDSGYMNLDIRPDNILYFNPDFIKDDKESDTEIDDELEEPDDDTNNSTPTWYDKFTVDFTNMDNTSSYSKYSTNSTNIDDDDDDKLSLSIGVLKMVDFNWLKPVDFFSENDQSPAAQTRAFRAPESILGIQCDQKSVVWSIATTVYEIVTGEIPFDYLINGISKDAVQIYDICCKLGPVPKHMVESSPKKEYIFKCNRVAVRGFKSIKYKGLFENILNIYQKDDKEKVSLLIKLLSEMLIVDYKKRASLRDITKLF